MGLLILDLGRFDTPRDKKQMFTGPVRFVNFASNKSCVVFRSDFEMLPAS
jgi:hypothetical protein